MKMKLTLSVPRLRPRNPLLQLSVKRVAGSHGDRRRPSRQRANLITRAEARQNDGRPRLHDT